jgi:hypothetical protein
MTDAPVHSVRDGSRVLKFTGRLIADEDSRRPNADRWSEIKIYRLTAPPGTGYIVSKVGYSTVVHEPTCSRVRHDMEDWAEVNEERRLPHSACPVCQPDLLEMSPHLKVERTRYRAMVAPDADALVDVLTEGRSSLPALIQRALHHAAKWDEDVRTVLGA